MGDHNAAETPDDATHPAPTVIEAKVAAASTLSLIVSSLLAVANAVLGNSTLLGALPPWSQALIIALAPPLLTFAAGYSTRSNRI